MAKIQDSEGKSWALMALKDPAGRVYIRAYINGWDAVKKRSYVQHRIQVGRLQSDGSIRLSDNFLKRFPSFADDTWFWGDQELLKQPDFQSKFPSTPEKPSIEWSDDNIRVGVTWAGWKYAEAMGILEDLTTAFGAKAASFILAIALFKLDGQESMIHFEDWVPQVWLPNIKPSSGQRISELLKSLTVTKQDNYYKCRYERAMKNSPNGTTLSFDSTSISTDSKTIEKAAFGHAKQNPDMRQVNYMAVADHATGDVVYACAYDGSITDKTILPTIYLQMKSAGIDLRSNILVTDRGFQSIYNTQTAINMELKYIQFLSVTEGAVINELNRKLKNLKDPIAHRVPELGLSAVTVKDHWTQDTDAGTIGIDAWLHLYRNATAAQEEVDDLLGKVREVHRIKVADAKRYQQALDLIRKQAEEIKKTKSEDAANKFLEVARKKLPRYRRVDEDLWSQVDDFLIECPRARGNASVWKIDYTKLNAELKHAGCQAIRTNAISDPIEAMRIYRQRNIIEEGFKQLKCEVGGKRLQCTDATYRGKLFVYSIAQAIRMHMLITARKTQQENPNLKMPEESLRKLFCGLQSVQARKHRSTNAFVLGTIPKRHRDLFALLGFDQKKLPKTVYRF
ncbi:MAG: hypothetical protein Q4E62_09900 [Sutterellaceae bacterium]|nr:hypothetical protein [Sutterellaceae bacterium]